MLQRLVLGIGTVARPRLSEAVASERRTLGMADEAGALVALTLEELERQADAAVERVCREAREEFAAEEERQRDKFLLLLLGSVGVSLSSWMVADDVADILAVRSAEFARLVTALAADLRNKIGAAANGGIYGGGAGAVEAAIADATEQAQRRAAFIARQELQTLVALLNEYRQRQIGVTEYEWNTIMDGRERPTHHVRHLRIFAWDAPPPGGHPGTEINCRCRALAVISEPGQSAFTGDPTPSDDAAVGCGCGKERKH